MREGTSDKWAGAGLVVILAVQGDPELGLWLGARGGGLQTQRHTSKFNLEQFFLHCLSGFVFKLKSLF